MGMESADLIHHMILNRKERRERKEYEGYDGRGSEPPSGGRECRETWAM